MSYNTDPKLSRFVIPFSSNDTPLTTLEKEYKPDMIDLMYIFLQRTRFSKVIIFTKPRIDDDSPHILFTGNPLDFPQLQHTCHTKVIRKRST